MVFVLKKKKENEKSVFFIKMIQKKRNNYQFSSPVTKHRFKILTKKVLTSLAYDEFYNFIGYTINLHKILQCVKSKYFLNIINIFTN